MLGARFRTLEFTKPFVLGLDVDFDLIRYWMKTYDIYGSDMNSAPEKIDMRRIRLIHVTERRVVQGTGGEIFATLSYVWGLATVSQAQLTSLTEKRLATHGALGHSEDEISLTIRHALFFCEHLYIPFLWVDALCIVQHSPNIGIQLGIMNDIYASSLLTIVAAAGQDSHAGLPGVVPRHNFQPMFSYDTCLLGLAHTGFVEAIGTSAWSRRAWTFHFVAYSWFFDQPVPPGAASKHCESAENDDRTKILSYAYLERVIEFKIFDSVRLMVFETDANGLSRKVSLCSMWTKTWENLEKDDRLIFLI